jgi:AAA domain
LAPDADSLISATIGLVDSNLPVQGPPGTGKTFLGARMVVAAMKAGMRVAVTAFSHAAIQNFLDMIEEHAAEIGFEFEGMYKGRGYTSRFGLVDTCDENKDTDGDFALVAGTAWLFARPEHRGRFGRLVIDEAGQFSLANAIAVGAVAESVIQGQEAAVVFFAMTCSSGEDVPRGLDFLFDRNRFNVAISRAQCSAVVVVNPGLLDADCRTLEAMQLVDGACRFVEMAAPIRMLEGVPFSGR